MRNRFLMTMCLVCVSGLLSAASARAVIMVLIPLNSVVDKEEFIFIARVKEILPDKPAMVLAFDENLKGKAPFERMPVNLTGDAEAKKDKHTEVLLDRIDKDTPIVIITTKRGGRYIAFGFTNGTWFQMEGRIEKQDDKEVVRWSFLHCEPYLVRTFKGTTEELKQIVVDAVAKKKAPPPPNEKEKPGFGPPIKKSSGVGGFPFAVIQLPFLGLIAALAALFPTVFGGLALFMKRWVALLSTSGIVSMFVTFPLIAPVWSSKLWCYSPSGLWLSCAILFTLGGLWSLRRYRRSFELGTSEAMQPRKFDRVFLTIFFAAGFISLLIGLKSELPIWSNEIWRWVLAGTAACGVAAWYIVSVYLRSKVPSPAHPLRVSAETVMLWVLVGLCTAYGSWEAGKFAKRDFVKGGGGIGQPTLNIEPVWTFAPDIGGVVVNTCATPERLYAAVMVVEGLSGRFGRVYALDPATGKELWKFDNNYENDSKNGMKPAFSAPVFADGRLYFGEGLHTDNDSRLFCLDAATGNKLWEYKTESHTESTPFVAEGKVVIGAGYHGLHCLDAVKGPGPDNTPLWRYPPNAKAADKSMHVDSNPMIANGKVYGGSGYKPDYVSNDGKINTIFCLDLNTGKEVWPPERVDDAAYCSPLVHDGMVFYGTGNSTYNETIPSKRPGILCRDAATGKVIWDRVLPENVMARPAADRYQLYVGCLDGKAYTLDLKTGKIVRSIEAGGPVLASPIIEVDPQTGIASSLYVVGKHGLIVAVHPYTGNLFWSNSLSYWTQEAVDELSATPTFLRVADNDKEIRRHFYFGFGQGRTGSTVPRLLCIEDRSAKE